MEIKKQTNHLKIFVVYLSDKSLINVFKNNKLETNTTCQSLERRCSTYDYKVKEPL